MQVRPVHNRSKCIFKCQVLKEDRPAWYLIISEMTFHVIPSVVMQLWGEFQRSTSITLYSLLIHYFLKGERQGDYFLSGLAFHLTNEKKLLLRVSVYANHPFNLICTVTRGTKHHREKTSLSACSILTAKVPNHRKYT